MIFALCTFATTQVRRLITMTVNKNFVLHQLLARRWVSSVFTYAARPRRVVRHKICEWKLRSYFPNRRVRVYDWPLPQESSAPCVELPVHSGPVSDLVVTPDDNFLFTCGVDGSVFALGIKVGIYVFCWFSLQPSSFYIPGHVCCLVSHSFSGYFEYFPGKVPEPHLSVKRQHVMSQCWVVRRGS